VNDSSMDLSILTDPGWSLVEPSWLTVNENVGIGDASIVVSNNGSRLGNIPYDQIVVTNDYTIKTLDVSYFYTTLSSSPTEWGFTYDENTKQFTINTESGNDWYVSSLPSWLQLDSSTIDELVLSAPDTSTKGIEQVVISSIYDYDRTIDVSYSYPILSVSPTEWGFTYDNSIKQFTISPSNVSDWWVSSIPTWTQIDTSTDSTVTLSVPDTSSKGIEQITINSLYDYPFTIDVSYYMDLFVTPITQTFIPSLSSTFTIDTGDSNDWWISSIPSWLNIDSSSGTGSGTFKLTATSLNNSESNVDISINSTYTDIKTIDVSFYYSPGLSVSPTEWTFSDIISASKQFNVTTGSLNDWYIETIPPWTTIDSSYGTGNGSFTLTTTSLTQDQSIYELATKSVYADDFTIDVSFYKPTIEATPLTLTFYDNSYGLPISQTIDVSTSDAWNLWNVVTPSWLTANPTSDSGDGTFTLTPDTSQNIASDEVDVTSYAINDVVIDVSYNKGYPTSGVHGMYPFEGNYDDNIGDNDGYTAYGHGAIFEPGHIGQSAYWLGANDFPTLSQWGIMGINNLYETLNDEWSISFWHKPLFNGDDEKIMNIMARSAASQTDGGNSNYVEQIGSYWTGGTVAIDFIAMDFYNGGWSSYQQFHITNVPWGEWVHLVYAMGSDKVYHAYVNGVASTPWGSPRSGKRTYTGITSAFDKVYVGGGYADTPDSYMSGNVDQLYIYNRLISQTEVTALYNESHPS